MEVGQTLHPQGLLFRPGQCRQQQRRQNGDDGDDHQQLNQGKCLRSSAALPQPLRSFSTDCTNKRSHIFELEPFHIGTVHANSNGLVCQNLHSTEQITTPFCEKESPFYEQSAMTPPASGAPGLCRAFSKPPGSHLERNRGAGFPACGFWRLSSRQFHGRKTRDKNVCATSKMETL